MRSQALIVKVKMAWRERGVAAMLDWAMKDPKSKVTYQHFPLASACLEQIENSTFSAAAPEMTPWEAMFGEQPDMGVWQKPLCRFRSRAFDA